jgi:hypothetical protein
VIEDIRNRKAGGHQQAAGNRQIEHDRDQRRMRQRARDEIARTQAARAHGATAFFGSTRVSIWKRSPGSDGARVVGA